MGCFLPIRLSSGGFPFFRAVFCPSGYPLIIYNTLYNVPFDKNDVNYPLCLFIKFSFLIFFQDSGNRFFLPKIVFCIKSNCSEKRQKRYHNISRADHVVIPKLSKTISRVMSLDDHLSRTAVTGGLKRPT